MAIASLLIEILLTADDPGEREREREREREKLSSCDKVEIIAMPISGLAIMKKALCRLCGELGKVSGEQLEEEGAS